MSTAVEKGYVVARLDELEAAPLIAPGATDDGRRRFDVRRRFDITSFGIQAFRAPNGVDVVREHDENLFGGGGQEELYLVLNGSATFEIDGESFETPAGSFVHVQPSSKRKAMANDEGTTILVVGGTPGKAYEPEPEEAPRHSPRTTKATTRPPSPSSSSSSRSARTIPSRTSTPGASPRGRGAPTTRSSTFGARSRSTSASRS